MSNLVKILFLGFLLGNSFSILAQKDTTILFYGAQPTNVEPISEVEKSLFGMYKDTSNSVWLQINIRGIFMTTAIMMDISKKDVDNNEQYKVIDGWIYGVSKRDSLPCELDGGIYHFGFPKKIELFSFDGKSNLKMIDEKTFMLSSKQKTDSTWQISQFYIDANTIEYYSFDQYKFSESNDSLSVKYFDVNENEILKSLVIKDPEFFNYPGVQGFFKLENVFRKE